jgi:GR25 family glycosyltransferase involved in LPS biosynthesis
MKIVRFPIIIFSYNRPDHLKKTLKALIQSTTIKHHKIFFFNDGPKNYKDKKKIEAIKKLINKYKKLIKFKKINFNKKNVGLFNNIIINVTSVLKKNKAAIILEDDILSSDNSLEFINFFLNKEKKSNKIGSVSGYSYLDDFKINQKFQLYLSKRHSSWAWGTWSHVWFKFKSDYLDKKNSNAFKLKTPGFESLGDDMEMMLWAQKNNLINSWSVLFNYFCFKEKYKCLQPRYSLVQNIGLDNSGTHSSLRSFFKKEKKIKYKFKFLKNNIYFFSRVVDTFIKKSNKESIKLRFLYIIKKFKSYINFKLINI